jgi:hypothetical protein
MPIRYELDDVHRRVVVTIAGPFAIEDFLAVIERQRGDNASAYSLLYDLRGMTGEPTIAELRQALSQSAQTHRRRGPLAILATNPALYDRACTYAALGYSTLTVGVFRDWDEAEQWLTAQAKAMEKGGARSAENREGRDAMRPRPDVQPEPRIGSDTKLQTEASRQFGVYFAPRVDRRRSLPWSRRSPRRPKRRT